MASTEAKLVFTQLAPDPVSVRAIVVWALGERVLSADGLVNLCRQDLAVLLAWSWGEPDELDWPALPYISLSERGQTHPHAVRQLQRWAYRLLKRWADWQPTVSLDWPHERLAPYARVLQRAGHLARLLAQRCHADPDQAEVAARLAAVGHVLYGCGLITRRALRGYFRQFAQASGWPAWLTETLLALDMPLPADGRIRRSEILNRVVQCAWQYAQADLPALLRLPGPDAHEILIYLGLDAGEFTGLQTGDTTPTCPETQASVWPVLLHLLENNLHAHRHMGQAERQAQRWRQLVQSLYADLETSLRERKLQALAVFAAGAGHELGNPVAVISGYAEQLLRDEKRLDRIQALERILAQCRRIDALIGELMFFARPPSPKLARCRLDKLLARCISQLRPYAADKSVTMHCQSSAKQCSIAADRSMLAAAIESLLRNAIEAAPAGGWVRCSLSRDSPTELKLDVEDNGPGPDPAWQEHIFDPFFSGREAGRGQGFGLCKVWRVAHLHGGQVFWQRTAQNTTVFTLRLPSRPPDAQR